MTITDLLVNLDCILWLLLFFLVLTGGAVYGFCALENRWLDG